MRSMTGYGRATREIDGRELTIELKSVNHRFLDLNFRMPRSFLFLEEDARKLIAAALSRGHVDVYMTYRNLRSDAKTVSLDRPLMDAYIKALDGVEGLKDDRTLMGLGPVPGRAYRHGSRRGSGRAAGIDDPDHERRPGGNGSHARAGGGNPSAEPFRPGGRHLGRDRKNRGALSPDGAGIHSAAEKRHCGSGGAERGRSPGAHRSRRDGRPQRH